MIPPLLTLSDIHVKRPDGFTLSVPALNVAAGEHVALIGASGSGKTTLLHIISGLLRPDAGDITLNGTAYSTLSGNALDALRGQTFGFVFQKLHLIGHLSVRDNIRLANPKADIATLLEPLGLAHKQKAQASTLSGGEAQRVAIARAVAHDPAVILADEPTSALDDANAAAVIDMLINAANRTGAALIIASHDARILPRIQTHKHMQNGTFTQ